MRVDAAADASALLVAAMMCSTALVATPRLRMGAQVCLVLLTMSAYLVVGAPWLEVLAVTSLLAILAGVVTRYATLTRSGGSIERGRGPASQRRTHLLATVRDLPSMDVATAAAAVCTALRSLGFDVGAAGLLRGDHLITIGSSGLDDPQPLPVDKGMAGRAVRERKTITVADYAGDPDRISGFDDIRASIATPIWAGPELVGVVIAARGSAGALDDGDVEVAEVLAAHLGAVIATRRQVENQRTLLERVDRLDSMRTAFADEVSDELRHPLTIVRGAGNTLLAHGDGLDPRARTSLLDRMCEQADQLQQVIDALLDFSRFQASHHQAQLRPVTLADLFAPLGDRVDLDVVGGADLQVEADPDLIRHAVELLIGGRTARVTVTQDGWSANISIAGGNPDAHTLMRSLVAQLVVEGGGVLDPADVPAFTLLRVDRDLEAVL